MKRMKRGRWDIMEFKNRMHFDKFWKRKGEDPNKMYRELHGIK